MQRDGWRGAERVLGWSFYSQGTDAAGSPPARRSSSTPSAGSATGRADHLAVEEGRGAGRALREARTLLVLDGLEPLQHPPGAQTGRLKDPAVAALVKELAAENPGLCVVTTRLAVADLAGRGGGGGSGPGEAAGGGRGGAPAQLGVEGPEKELRAASEEFGGHALALTLLGTFLRGRLDGDVRRREEAAVLDEAIEGGEHAQVIAAYARWLGPGPELPMLRLLGLFDRPAEAGGARGAAGGAGDPGAHGAADRRRAEEKAWQARPRAPAPGAAGGAGRGRRRPRQGALDAHPLVREHFGEQLRQAAPEAWQAGNQRLYEHLRQAAPDLPGHPGGDAAPLRRGGPRLPGGAAAGGVRRGLLAADPARERVLQHEEARGLRLGADGAGRLLRSPLGPALRPPHRGGPGVRS